MRSKSSRVNVRITAIAVAVIASMALAACGSSSDGSDEAGGESGPQRLAFELSKAGQLSGPAKADAGLSELSLDNQDNLEANLQLIRVEGKHSVDEVLDGAKKAREVKPVPSWFFVAGGVGEVAPRKSAEVEQVLAPGNYVAVNTEGEALPQKKATASFEVTGKATADEQLSAPDGKVTASEYTFKTTGLHAGPGRIVFENAGKQPHNLIVSEILKGNDVKDVERYFKKEERLAPLSSEIHRVAAAIEGGESQVIPLDLKPGNYVFMCFVSDRQGGAQHALKGQLEEVQLK
ncbi:MAG TPA: hypothetical protein VFR04_02780 [Solirubrobacterales bacterium]|nr:hypothetical protein [Solirubrobacterales bacterium]